MRISRQELPVARSETRKWNTIWDSDCRNNEDSPNSCDNLSWNIWTLACNAHEAVSSKPVSVEILSGLLASWLNHISGSQPAPGEDGQIQRIFNAFGWCSVGPVLRRRCVLWHLRDYHNKYWVAMAVTSGRANGKKCWLLCPLSPSLLPAPYLLVTSLLGWTRL